MTDGLLYGVDQGVLLKAETYVQLVTDVPTCEIYPDCPDGYGFERSCQWELYHEPYYHDYLTSRGPASYPLLIYETHTSNSIYTLFSRLIYSQYLLRTSCLFLFIWNLSIYWLIRALYYIIAWFCNIFAWLYYIIAWYCNIFAWLYNILLGFIIWLLIIFIFLPDIINIC